MQRTLIKILIFFSSNSFSQTTTIADAYPPIVFEKITVRPSDSITYQNKIYRLRISEKCPISYLPKAIYNGTIVFVDNAGKIQPLNVISYTESFKVKGSISDFHVDGYLLRPYDFDKIPVGGKILIANIILSDKKNLIFKNKVFEIVRLK